jgi:hypothetical protein
MAAIPIDRMAIARGATTKTAIQPDFSRRSMRLESKSHSFRETSAFRGAGVSPAALRKFGIAQNRRRGASATNFLQTAS